MEQIALSPDMLAGILEDVLEAVQELDSSEGVISWKLAEKSSQDAYEREAASRQDYLVGFRYRIAEGVRISRREALLDLYQPQEEK